MTPLTADADVHVATEDDIQKAVQSALADVGLTLSKLRQEAATGQFSSDRARRAWFTVSPVARRA